MSEVVITVRGQHEAQLAPEIGIAHLTVRAEGPERGAVVEQIAAFSVPVRDDLAARRQAGAVVEWSSQRVSVWSERPWNAEGKRLAQVHHASVEFSATFTDFAALSWWVGDVVEREGVQFDWVEWRLTPDTRASVERTVAAEAVRTAVTRATAYADAIGLASVTPLEIADLGLLSRQNEAPGGSFDMLRAAPMAAKAGGGAPSVQLLPEDITVSAGVEARFVAR